MVPAWCRPRAQGQLWCLGQSLGLRCGERAEDKSGGWEGADEGLGKDSQTGLGLGWLLLWGVEGDPRCPVWTVGCLEV